MNRKTLAVADQILAGMSNWITSALAAATLSTVGFGLFSRNLVIATFAAGLGGTISVEPWIAASAQRINMATARRDLSGAVWRATLVCMLTALVAMILVGEGRNYWLLASVVGGAVIVHINGAIRLACLASGEVLGTIAADLLWLIGTPALILIPGLRIAPWPAWIAGGEMSVFMLICVGLLSSRSQVPHGSPTTMRASVGWLYALDYGLTHVVSTGSILALGYFAGEAALGTFSGIMLLFAPIALAFNSSRTIGVPFVASRLHHGASSDERRSTALRYLVPSLVGVTIVYEIAVFLLPTKIGRFVLGDTWQSVAALRPPAAVMYLCTAVATAAVLSLRIAGRASTIAVARAGGVLAGGVVLAVLGFTPRTLLSSWTLYSLLTALLAIIATDRRFRKSAPDSATSVSSDSLVGSPHGAGDSA